MKKYDYKIVLLLGGVDSEGITSHLKSVGSDFTRKLLLSSVNNWKKILNIIDNYDVTAVLGKITPRTCDIIANHEYSIVANQLFEKVSNIPHVFYMFEGLMTGEQYPDNPYDEDEPYYTYSTSPGSIEKVLSITSKYNINILPYKSISDITFTAQSFLEQTESGLLFRVYMPAGQVYENELDKVFVLFRDYLSKICGEQIRLEQNKTNNG